MLTVNIYQEKRIRGTVFIIRDRDHVQSSARQRLCRTFTDTIYGKPCRGTVCPRLLPQKLHNIIGCLCLRGFFFHDEKRKGKPPQKTTSRTYCSVQTFVPFLLEKNLTVHTKTPCNVYTWLPWCRQQGKIAAKKFMAHQLQSILT